MAEEQSSYSTAEQHDNLCLPFDEVVMKLPYYMKPQDNKERAELAMFLSQEDQRRKTGGDKNVSANSVLDYIKCMLEAATRTEEATSKDAQSDSSGVLLELNDQVTHITGKVACEIACKVINGFESHDVTLSVLNVLQAFSWETRVAVTVATFILTFGDKGRNLCAQSKLCSNDVSNFVKHLLEITSIIVEFEKLPTIYLTINNPKVVAARTNFVVCLYWIIRDVMVTATSHIMTASDRSGKLVMANSPLQCSKRREEIGGFLRATFTQLQELLEDELENEAYEKLKQTVLHEDHSDNMIVLSALFSTNDDTPQLYDGLIGRKVHLNVLRGKYVLLILLSELKVVNNLDHVQQVINEVKEHSLFEMVLIPVGRSVQAFENVKNIKRCYSVDSPWTIRKEVIKFFREDWKFEGGPMIVVLDPRGKVIRQNAINMLYIWGSNAFPFTVEREETLWVQETWDLELLFGNVVGEVLEAIRENKYIFVLGGKDFEWNSSFAATVQNDEAIEELLAPVEMFYVTSHNAVDLKNERIVLGKPLLVWILWKRIESMIHSMVQLGKVDCNIFHQIQRLYNHNKCNVEWFILAKGSEIIINGRGQVAETTLQEYEVWEEKSSREGFGVAFESHYRKLHQKKFPFQHIEFRVEEVEGTNAPTSMECPDCQSKMEEYTAFVCYHES